MNYNIFERRDLDCRIQPGETEQAYMERIFRAACAEDAGLDRITDRMALRFVACDAAKPSVTLEFAAQDWLLNSKSTLHGGVIATALDTTMGLLGRWCRGVADVSTVTLNVHFLRAGLPGCVFRVHVEAEKQGQRVIFQRAELTEAESGALIATATATFM